MSDSNYMGIPRRNIPWFPTIDEDMCTGCGECVEFCDHGVYAVDSGKTVVVHPYHCVVGCTACLKACPVGAISFPSEEELVSRLRELRSQRDAGK